jgi:hypothetical protein
MGRQIVTAGLSLRVTLEASATGAVSDNKDERRLSLDYPISNVIGVWAAASEAGTNLYDDTCSQDGTSILMGEGTVAASTVYYVSYNIETHLPVIGMPAGHQGSIMGVYSSAPLKIESLPATDYEIADPVGSGAVILLLGSMECTITSIKIRTDGTNCGLYLYSDATADPEHMEFNKTSINLLWFSTDDFSDLKIPFDTGEVYLAIVDTGANATPANTYVTLRGHVGI